MGGKSTGTFRVDQGVGVFEGEVVDVPFLHAPGFIQARTVSGNYADISSCHAFKLTLKANNGYKGYRFSFGDQHAQGGKLFAYGYKVTLEDVPVGDFGDVVLPFDSFTDFWDDATGDPIVTCHEDAKYCPTTKALRNLKRLAIWGEGVGGRVLLEIQSISAVGCASASTRSSPRQLRASLLRGWKNQLGLPVQIFDYFR